MPSGWEVYYLVLLSAVFALSVPLVLRAISILVSKSAPSDKTSALPHTEAPLPLGRKVNTRFFLSANAALLLIAFGLALIPCVGVLKSGDAREALGGMIAILTLSGFCALGLLYSARKGDLHWLRSLRGKSE